MLGGRVPLFSPKHCMYHNCDRDFMDIQIFRLQHHLFLNKVLFTCLNIFNLLRKYDNFFHILVSTLNNYFLKY